jgi:3-oxoacyl-[acyl-carrier protein] reductase
MLTDLRGKAVLITGASTGIGAAAAQAFGAVGARVGVHFRRNKDAAESVSAKIRSSGGEAAVLAADLVSSKAAGDLVADFVGRFGRIDVLINNAGDMGGRKPFLEVTDDFYDEILDLNLRQIVFTSKAAIACYQQQGNGGVIINTTSVAARNGGGPGAQLYGSAKAFIQTLTRGLAKEYAAHGIRVNAVAPGVIDTPFHARHSGPGLMEAMRKSIPMQRLGTPEDCAGAYLFLASNALSSFITGQVIEVNGGQLMP